MIKETSTIFLYSEFTSASIVEVGSVMPATVVETISCTYDDTFENDNRKKIPEVETGLEQEQRISSALSPATAERLEVDFERLSARSLVVDVIGCVGDCYLGLRNADEACLAAWMKIGSGSCSDSDHADSIRNFLPTEVPLVWGGYCTSLDEQSKKACLREMEIFRRADADDAFRESKNSWTGDRADAESVLVNDSKEVLSTVNADAAESSFPDTLSVLCNRLLHILRASGINLIFSPSSHKNTVQISPHNSSKIDHGIREQTAAKAAMLVALSSYGQYEDPKLNIGIQILKFVKVSLKCSLRLE